MLCDSAQVDRRSMTNRRSGRDAPLPLEGAEFVDWQEAFGLQQILGFVTLLALLFEDGPSQEAPRKGVFSGPSQRKGQGRNTNNQKSKGAQPAQAYQGGLAKARWLPGPRPRSLPKQPRPLPSPGQSQAQVGMASLRSRRRQQLVGVEREAVEQLGREHPVVTWPVSEPLNMFVTCTRIHLMLESEAGLSLPLTSALQTMSIFRRGATLGLTSDMRSGRA